MDFQNRAGSKGAGIASHGESQVDRRDRLRKLALETIDLAKDPYFMKNHLGSYECKLCLTLHANEGSYLAHTQGKKHQTNLARRAAKDTRTTESTVPLPSQKIRPTIRRNYIKIGRPGYKITKIREPETHQLGLLIQISYPEVSEGLRPYHRFMSAYEQRMEAPNKQIQYLLVHAEPYEVIAFKIQSVPIDREDREGVEGDFGRGFWTHWDKDAKMYTLQLLFKIDPVEFMRKQLVAGGRGSMSRSFAPLPIPLPLPLPAPIQLAPPHPLILRPPPPL